MAVIAIFFWVPTNPNSLFLGDSMYYFNPEVKKQLALILGILTCVAPLVSLLIMQRTQMVTSLNLDTKEERTYPFVLVIFYFGLAYFFLRFRMDATLQHDALMSFLWGIIVTFVVCLIINTQVKISLHAVAVFGVLAAVIAYFQSQSQAPFGIVYIIVLIGGLVGMARIYLKAHTLNQVLLGMLVGFGCIYTIMKLAWWI